MCRVTMLQYSLMGIKPYREQLQDQLVYCQVTDGLDHEICIIWDVINLVYSFYFDSALVMTYNGNIRTNFANPTNVYYGFTAGSGGANQNQCVCNIDMATNPVNPVCLYTIPIASYVPVPVGICSGETTVISLSSTVVGTTYSWVANDNLNVAGESTVASIDETLTNLTLVD